MSDTYIWKPRRLRKYDYSSPGAYFLTMCTDKRLSILSNVRNGKIELTNVGQMILEAWNSIPHHFINATTDEAFVVMPNHIHGIIWIHERHSSTRGSSTTIGETASVTSIVRWFKSLTTNRWQKMQTSSPSLWQRNYHDHIIRAKTSLANITSYIIGNPLQWQTDEYFSDHVV